MRSSGKSRCTIDGALAGEALNAGARTSLDIPLLPHQSPPERVDVARAHHKTYIALAKHSPQDCLGLGEAWQPVHRLPQTRVRGRLRDQQPAHAGMVLGALTRRVDVE